MKHPLRTSIAIAILGTIAAGGFAGQMSKADFNREREAISISYMHDKIACDSRTGNARDICIQEAKGREQVGRAELTARDEPSDKHRFDWRIAKADADFAVAKEKCDDVTGNAKDVCRKEATRAHVAASADAKVQQTSSEANAKAQETTDAANRKADAATHEALDEAGVVKREAAYGVARERCDAAVGDAKEACIRAAKTQFGQP